jgi:endoglucanase
MGMKRQRKISFFSIFMAVIIAVTGCGGTQEETEQTETKVASEQDMIQQSMFGRGEDFGALLVSQGITLPVSTTKVFVNQAGYISNREKKVMFFGEQLGNTFRVVSQADKTVVYTGRIEEGRLDEISGCYLSEGDFSEVTDTGTYYIETDIVGQSYPFRITPDGYENMFVGMLKNVSDVQLVEDAQGICDISFGMHAIMYAMQCNGSLFEEAYKQFGEEEKDRQLVSQLLYFAGWLKGHQGTDGSLYGDYEATAAFCGIMAMSRDMFGRYEASVSKEYKEAADKAWAWLSKQECDTDVRKNARFYAAVQLFRVQFNEEYKTIVETFLKEKNEDYSAQRFVFYGVIAYISAGENTDRDLCTHIMKDLVDRNEDTGNAAKNDTFFGTGKRSVYDNLYNMLLLCFINDITPSKEYTEIIENTIQYMGGLNENGVCYIDESGAWKELSETSDRNLEWNGILLFGMSDMLKNLIDIEKDW